MLVLAAVALVLAGCASDGGASEPGPLELAFAPIEGETLRYELSNAGTDLGTGVLETRREGDLWALTQRYEGLPDAEGERAVDSSRVLVDGDLRPSSSERVIEHTSGEVDRYTVEYRPEEGRLTSVVSKDGSDDSDELALREHAYDNEASFWIWRSLPLAEDYVATYSSMNPFERSQQTVEVMVTARVEVTVPAGAFDTWRLQVRSGRATGIAWVEVAAPHRIIQWDSGRHFMRLTAP